MKKLIAILLSVAMVMSLCVFTASAADVTEISLWTYPIGKWVDEATVSDLLADFHAAHPEIKVNVEYLDYTNGDDKVNTAIEGKQAPDIIMEGPERLIANWGAKGLMVNLADLIPEGTYSSVVESCTSANGEVYEMPVCMIAHCMAINRDVFAEADALKYLNEETHTWNSVEDFFKAVQAVYDAGYEYVGCIYCGGQGGDQGTRALVTNVGGGTYANAEHTAYTYASVENATGLSRLYNQQGINFDPSIVAGDEIQNFVNGTFQMAFCWNISQEVNNADALSFDVLPMAFPSDSTPSLQGGIWGFGVFDNGDAAKIDAAKTFIKYFADGEGTADAVKAASYFAVRDTAEGIDLTGIWADNAIMNEYTKLMPYLGDYYQVTAGWATARTEWWNMLQRVGGGGDVATEVATFCENANAAAAAG